MITIDGRKMNLRDDLDGPGYTLKDLGDGDYAVKIKHDTIGKVIISGRGS
jgi:hypothetical protein